MIFSAFTRSVQRFKEDKIANVSPGETPRLSSHSINFSRLLFSNKAVGDGLSFEAIFVAGTADSLFTELVNVNSSVVSLMKWQ